MGQGERGSRFSRALKLNEFNKLYVCKNNT